MKKKTTAEAISKERCRARLDEIASISLGALGDDEALAIIKERKELEALFKEYEKTEKEAALAARTAALTADLHASIEELNRSIAPDKSDEELFALIGRRKDLEMQLRALETGQAAPIETETLPEERKAGSHAAKAVFDAPQEVPAEEPAASASEASPVPVAPAVPVPAEEEMVEKPVAADNFGNEGIRIDTLEVTGELKQYLDQLESNTGSLGTMLQRLPAPVKANKTFMLKVAEIDPAYAIHYADAGLKQDEDFGIRLAGMPNKRNSGNVLAEIDPEMRTSKMVMAGVKQDYRNIRFASPDMEGYREMLEIAKRGTLHKVQELKEGADVSLLVPKALQNDREFMQQIEKITASAVDGNAVEAISAAAQSDKEKGVWKSNLSVS